MKRFTLAAIVAAAMVVCATATARAETYRLTPPPGSDFPHATGSVSVTIQGPFRVPQEYYYKVWLDWRVTHLAPRQVYGLVDGNLREWAQILTDAKGNGTVSIYSESWNGLLWAPRPDYIVVGSAGIVLSSK